MVASNPNLSDEFRVTAEREAARLTVEATELRRAHETHLRRANELLGQAIRVERHLQELEELLGRAPQLRMDLQDDGLRGRRLAFVAADVLARDRGVGSPIHYRDWFKLLLESKRRVPGRNPLANFLTEITRSPLVERLPGRHGVYRLNPDAAEAGAMKRLKAAELRLLAAEQALAEASGGVRQRSELSAARREHTLAQRALASVLADGTQLRQAILQSS